MLPPHEDYIEVGDAVDEYRSQHIEGDHTPDSDVLVKRPCVLQREAEGRDIAMLRANADQLNKDWGAHAEMVSDSMARRWDTLADVEEAMRVVTREIKTQTARVFKASLTNDKLKCIVGEECSCRLEGKASCTRDCGRRCYWCSEQLDFEEGVALPESFMGRRICGAAACLTAMLNSEYAAEGTWTLHVKHPHNNGPGPSVNIGVRHGPTLR